MFIVAHSGVECLQREIHQLLFMLMPIGIKNSCVCRIKNNLMPVIISTQKLDGSDATKLSLEVTMIGNTLTQRGHEMVP